MGGRSEDLLHFLEGYGFVKKRILEKSPLNWKSLSDARLNEKRILVLGIEREKVWIPTPKASEIIKNCDDFVVYGPLKILKFKLE